MMNVMSGCVCKYCNKKYEWSRINFQSACNECTQKLIDVQLPYIHEIKTERESIVSIEQKIASLIIQQHDALDNMANQLYQPQED